jgi:hypothetical protein
MHRKTAESLLAISLLLTLAACGKTPSGQSAADAPAAAAASTPSPAAPAAAASPLPKPEALVTPAEAAALLGGDAVLEVHDMHAIYPGSVDFAYQTKNIRILSAAFYPQGGAEMFGNMKKTLSAPGRHPLLPCSVGDSCFLQGKAMIHVLKGGTYFTLADDNADPGKLEELGRTVAGRI